MQDGCSSKSIVHMSHVRDEKRDYERRGKP